MALNCQEEGLDICSCSTSPLDQTGSPPRRRRVPSGALDNDLKSRLLPCFKKEKKKKGGGGSGLDESFFACFLLFIYFIILSILLLTKSYKFYYLCQEQYRMVQRAGTTVDECFLTKCVVSCLKCRIMPGQHSLLTPTSSGQGCVRF